jgi:hypothetical protein
MSDENLSPELTASRDALVAEYTSHALRCVPEGTLDAVPTFNAMKRILNKVHTRPPKKYVHLRYQPDHPDCRPDNPVFMWMTEQGHRPVGHVEAIPVGWYKLDKRNQPTDTGFVLTGPFDKLINVARLYYGKTDLPQNWLAGQLSALVVAYSRWVIEFHGERKGDTPIDRELLACVEEFCLNVGVALCFDVVFFAGDPPVGFKNLAAGDSARRPVWSGAHAKHVGGMKLTDHGIWVDE